MDGINALYSKTITPVFKGVGFIYNKTHWFTDKEAWAIFRFFAILEAIGWSMLIGAIMYRSFGLPEYESVISVAGRMHGLFFSLYFLFVLLTARSMKWGFWRVLVALIAGMPPYTSLVFEQIMAYDRRKRPVHVEPPANLD